MTSMDNIIFKLRKSKLILSTIFCLVRQWLKQGNKSAFVIELVSIALVQLQLKKKQAIKNVIQINSVVTSFYS